MSKETAIENIVHTTLSEIFWLNKEEGIVYAKTKPKINTTVEHLKEEMEVYKNGFFHEHRKIIIDMSELGGANKQARDFFAGPEGVYNYFDAVAILIRSKYSIAYIIVSVALKVYFLRKPTKIVFTTEEAIEWFNKL